VSRRSERVAEEIREEVARLLAREVRDPRIGFVTVTRVSLTPDLHVARVYVGVLGDETQRKRTLAGLRHSAGYMRRLVGQRLRLRTTPELHFSYDEGLDATERVAQLLDETHAVAPPPDAEGEGEA
jgi:ribosome-binding factor A